MNILKIDGSYGEGGGSIVRIATALSVLTSTPINIFNIRANRNNPGLREQHLNVVNAISSFCGGEVEGCFIGSREIKFFPNDNFKKFLRIKIRTAGSIPLLLYALSIASLSSNEKLKVIVEGGATYGKWAPTIDYLKEITFKQLEKIRYKIEVDVERHGFYPVGGAKVKTIFYPNEINEFKVENENEIKAFLVSSIDLKERSVLERAKQEILKRFFGKKVKFVSWYVNTKCSGCGLTLVSGCLGACGVGEKGIRIENITREIVNEFLFQEGYEVDFHFADQILPFLAIKGEKFNFKVIKKTPHFLTNEWLLKKFGFKV